MYHQVVTSARETTLIPAASNAELKALLTTGLKIFRGIKSMPKCL